MSQPIRFDSVDCWLLRICITFQKGPIVILQNFQETLCEQSGYDWVWLGMTGYVHNCFSICCKTTTQWVSVGWYGVSQFMLSFSWAVTISVLWSVHFVIYLHIYQNWIDVYRLFDNVSKKWINVQHIFQNLDNVIQSTLNSYNVRPSNVGRAYLKLKGRREEG